MAGVGALPPRGRAGGLRASGRLDTPYPYSLCPRIADHGIRANAQVSSPSRVSGMCPKSPASCARPALALNSV